MLRTRLGHTLLATCAVALLALGAAPTSAEPDAGAPVAAKTNPEAAGESDTPDAVDAKLTQRFEAPEQARVGQRLELQLDVEHPAGASVHLPDAFGNPRWELADTRRDTVKGDAAGADKTTLTLDFQIFRPGSTTLPSFPVTVMTSEGASTQLATEPIEAKVVSVLPADKTPDMKPHRAPVAVWTDDYTLAWVGGGLLTALLAAGLTFVFARRREEEVGPPPRPAHIVALEKLSALTTDDLLDRGEYMLYYVRMSEAVREYLGRRYGFRGTELTTTEILDHLERVEWPAGLSHEDVREWLLHCDLIKFSGVIPARERAEQALRRGFSIVELTRPRDEAPDGEAESEESGSPESELPESESLEQPPPSESEKRDAEIEPRQPDSEDEKSRSSDDLAASQPESPDREKISQNPNVGAENTRRSREIKTWEGEIGDRSDDSKPVEDEDNGRSEDVKTLEDEDNGRPDQNTAKTPNTSDGGEA
ncbi:hypothetical protein FIV42_26215 [Persicimonas caeni]|uniref:DUF4381 family protein n=1 Tax=Persicimonas caeni TaxID=2292766 RepID=A0A4Y6Q0Z5_PERCE|nr:hypothetical protein [Persicimonas caeni]QDG54109.1 hypothetical protein FIV42_26215 [Persicimonas caeni]QED35330.1 hypothetical protein FRD00_26210 [Persicimonas caeni]